MLFMAGPQNLPKNDHVLQKVFELRPQLPAKFASSFKPWPKDRFSWTTSMKNWSKDTIPLGKPMMFVDINQPHDKLTTNACQKDFAYTTAPGNNKNHQKLNARKYDSKQKINPTGNSGLSVWEICQRNSNRDAKY